MERLKLATIWLGGCSGCHMSFLDLDEFLLDLAERVDIVYTPLIDVKEYPEGVDVVLVEGAVASDETPGDDPQGPRPDEGARRVRRLRRDGQRHVVAQPAGRRRADPPSRLSGRRRPQPADPLGAGRPARAAGPGGAGAFRRPGRLPHDGLPPAGTRIRAVLEQLLDGKGPHLEGREIKFG